MTQFWYCVKHHTVEHDDTLCPTIDRLGPFDSEQEASQALDTAERRNDDWDNDPKWNDDLED